ncbi:MAG: hypothetical protein ACP5G4_10300 [bacterium]
MNEYNITQKEIEDGKGLGGLAYITWIGLLIAFLTGKENRYVMYHVQQGLVLVIASILTVIPSLVGSCGVSSFWFARLSE